MARDGIVSAMIKIGASLPVERYNELCRERCKYRGFSYKAMGVSKRRLSRPGVRKEGSTRFPAGDFTPVAKRIAAQPGSIILALIATSINPQLEKGSLESNGYTCRCLLKLFYAWFYTS